MLQRETIDPTYSRVAVLAFTASITARPAAAMAANATVHLWSNATFQPTWLTSQADFNAAEANFTDYAAANLTITQPTTMGDSVIGGAGEVEFGITNATPAVTGTALGYWVASDAGVLMFEAFTAGQEVPFALQGDRLSLLVELPVQSFQRPAD